MNGAAATGELATRWRTLRTGKPGIRARDAAAEIGVSEAELVETMVGDTAVRLDGNAASLVHALTEVGRCMALTRNAHAVSEVRGRYGGVELGAHAGQVVGENIDLRVFLDHWRNSFAIDEPHPQRAGERRRSIHVFDRTGTAVHKVYLEPEGDAATWNAVVATRTVTAPLAIEPAPARRAEKPDSAIEHDLHLRTDRIAGSWVVAKPTRSGVVSSLELFDRDGEVIALVFRKRDDRERAEDPAWRGVLDRLAGVQR